MKHYSIYSHNSDEKSTNLLATAFRSRYDHGGHAEEHREEMETIAREVCSKALEDFERRMYVIAQQAYEDAIKDFLHALEYDIESITRIGIDGCKDIFEGKKAQKFISDHIMKEIEKRLSGKYFRK